MQIHLDNLSDGDGLPHSLVLLEGVVHGFHAHARPREQWFLRAGLASDPRNALFWPVTESGRFKALVQLPHASSAYEQPTRHGIALHVMGTEYSRMFHVVYRPVKTRYQVRFYYQRCADAPRNEGFDAPVGTDASDEAAKDRIRLGVLLMQTSMAEMLHQAGQPRQTFVLEFETNGSGSRPCVHALPPVLTAVDLPRDKEAFAGDTECVKHIVIMDCSRGNKLSVVTDDNKPAGLRNAGVFHWYGLDTWPRRLHELTACCLDNDPTSSRSTKGSIGSGDMPSDTFAETIGRSLQELGVILGIERGQSGIMAKGFTEMNKLWNVHELITPLPGSGITQTIQREGHDDGFVPLRLSHELLREVQDTGGAHFDDECSRQFVKSSWIVGEITYPTWPSITRVLPPVEIQEVRGAIGHAYSDGSLTPFNLLKSATVAAGSDVGAICIEAEQYLESFRTISRRELAADRSIRSQLSATGNSHCLVLTPHEYITRVEVRAMAWIDGLRIHTNLRSTRWYGGFGGELHELRASHGLRVHDFFGAKGATFVGRLGIYCSAIPGCDVQPKIYPSITPRGIQKYAAVGQIRQTRSTPQFGLEKIPFGSVFVITCDAHRVIDFRPVAKEDHSRATQHTDEPAVYGANEHIWELLPGEFLTSVDVRYAHWVEALRFRTNRRLSPWFGGGHSLNVHELTCPPSKYVCGIHGMIRKRVGMVSFGIYVGDFVYEEQVLARTPQLDGVADVDMVASSENVLYGNTHPSGQSLSRCALSAIEVPEANTVESNSAVPGVLILVQHGKVSYVASFASENEKHGLIRDMKEPPNELDMFTFQPDSRISHVFAAVDGNKNVVGICFRTKWNDSEWFGEYRHEQFYMFASSGHVLSTLRTNSCETGSRDLIEGNMILELS